MAWRNNPNRKVFPSAKVSLVAGLMCLVPSFARGQGLGSAGMSDFPADTLQVAYLNLAELRRSSDYLAIHRQLFDQRMDEFEMFLRGAGTDAEKDVDEVLLGWRGPQIERENSFGVASGRFEPAKAHDFAVQQRAPLVKYAGIELYGFGTGDSRSEVYFTFFDDTTAAFGRLADLKALVDVHSGDRPALDSSADIVGWEGELEGTAPQWGIATGKAAASQAAPWLAGSTGLPVDPTTIMAPIKAVLYSTNWSSGFTAHLTLLCQTPDNATALAKLITLWKLSRQSAAAKDAPDVSLFIQSLQVQANGSRVELSATGPVEIVGQIIRGPGSGED